MDDEDDSDNDNEDDIEIDIDIDGNPEDDADDNIDSNTTNTKHNEKTNNVVQKPNNVAQKPNNVVQKPSKSPVAPSRPQPVTPSEFIGNDNSIHNNRISSNTVPIKNSNKKDNVSDTRVVNKVVDKVNNANQVSSSRKINYDSLDASKLYNFVALFMKKNGVKNSGISKDLLNKEFGASNIKRLVSKSYLIQLYDGTLTFNR